MHGRVRFCTSVGSLRGLQNAKKLKKLDLTMHGAKRWISGIAGTLLTVDIYFALSTAFGSPATRSSGSSWLLKAMVKA